jgi:hypothetical protein
VNKTWLLFEEAVVASGDAVLPSTGGLVTTIEQSLLNGVVVVGQERGAGEPLAANSTRVLDLSVAGVWVVHAGVGYLLPQTPGASVHVSNTYKTGSWRDIGVDSTAQITMAVFDFYLMHGSQYSYTILPTNATASEMPGALTNTAGYSTSSGGTAGYRAATDSRGKILLGAVWAAAGTVVNVDQWRVRASRACAFTARRWANASLSASLSVPGADSGNATLIIYGAATKEQLDERSDFLDGDKSCVWAADGSLTLIFDLPGGDYIGGSVSVICAGPDSAPGHRRLSPVKTGQIQSKQAQVETLSTIAGSIYKL